MEKKLPTPQEILDKYPLSKEIEKHILYSRQLSKKIFSKEEKKTVIFVGPCSIHSPSQTIEYAKELKKTASHIDDNIFVIMRFFHEKSRSSLGWKGFFYDPDLNNTCDIEKGIIETRKLMIQLSELKIPLATEILDPFAINYFKDLITWGFIGSRTSSSQIHRQIASSMPFPVGLKNNSDGNLDIALNGVVASKAKQTYLNISSNGNISSFKSSGNPYSHIVLRGSEKETNHKREAILNLYKKMDKKNIYSPIVIDCSHDNSKKSLDAQKKEFSPMLVPLL
jgi:3-deoxy-7-phosphoheptulonate synthase